MHDFYGIQYQTVSYTDGSSEGFSKTDIPGEIVPFGCLRFMVFTKMGLLTAGKDGVVRLVTFNRLKRHTTKTENYSEAPGSNIADVEVANCLRIFKRSQGILGMKITQMAMSASFGRLAITTQTGKLTLMNVASSTIPEKIFAIDRELYSSCDAFVNIGLLAPRRENMCIVSNNIWLLRVVCYIYHVKLLGYTLDG